MTLAPSAMSHQNGQRKRTGKTIFKGFKERPRLPANYEQDQWSRLKDTVDAIHGHTSVEHSLEELCQSVENLCNHDMSARLFDKLYMVCRVYIESLKQRFLKDCSDSEGFLKLTNRVWSDHCEEMKWIRKIFLMLDRTYVLQQSSIQSIWDMGVDLFRSIILEDSTISQRIVDGLLLYVERERKQETVDRSLLKNLLRMLSDLQIYELFELPFLQATNSLYKEEGQILSSRMELPVYIAHVNQRLQEENDRLIHYLHTTTKKELIGIVERNLIQDHLKSCILQRTTKSGFDQLMDDDRIEDISLLYELCSRVPHGLQDLVSAFGKYVKLTGKGLIAEVDAEKDKRLVQNLLDYKEKIDRLVVECFRNNEDFVYRRKEAFEDFINTRQNKPAELIAKYVDSRMRAGNKELTEDELEHSLDKLMVLFRFIHGKDVFEAFYKKDLAKRLLLDKSASIDAEKSMVSKLKQECGAAFTQKLEGMFKDMNLSKDIMVGFRPTLEAKDSKIDLHVNVCQMGNWPTTPDHALNCVYPPMADYLQTEFAKFYSSKYAGRKLQWQPASGTCMLRAHYPKGTKELQVSVFQGIVLLQYNSGDIRTFEELQQGTGIDKEELVRTLQSLAMCKVRFLNKEHKSKEIKPSEKFTAVKDFSHKLFRIKINSIQLKETEKEHAQTHEKVFQDRQYQVDAAVVRIMKMRRSLTHTALITELFEQLRFPVKAQDLKRRIESLIERDYMERDTDSNGYIYKA